MHNEKKKKKKSLTVCVNVKWGGVLGWFNSKGAVYLPLEAARSYSICLYCDLTLNILLIKDVFLLMFLRKM